MANCLAKFNIKVKCIYSAKKTTGLCCQCFRNNHNNTRTIITRHTYCSNTFITLCTNTHVTLDTEYAISHLISVSCFSIVTLLTTVMVGVWIHCTRTARSQSAPAAPQRRRTASGNLLLITWRRSRRKNGSPDLLLGRWWSSRMKLVTQPETRAMSWTGTTQITSTGGPLLLPDNNAVLGFLIFRQNTFICIADAMHWGLKFKKKKNVIMQTTINKALKYKCWTQSRRFLYSLHVHSDAFS